MSSIKKQDQEKLEVLKGKSTEKAMKLISKESLQEVLAKAQGEKAKVRALLNKVETDKGELERAVNAEAVIKETTYNLEQLDPEYAELVKRVEALELQFGGSATVVGKVGDRAPIKEELRAAKLCLEKTKNIVSDAVAEQFKFESYSQVRNIIKTQQYKA